MHGYVPVFISLIEVSSKLLCAMGNVLLVNDITIYHYRYSYMIMFTYQLSKSHWSARINHHRQK